MNPFVFLRQPKNLFLCIALLCAGLLCFAFILQYFVDLIPCPLCIAQRFFYLLIGLTALAACFRWFRAVSVRAYGSVIAFLALLGGAIAARQVYLQHFAGPVDPTKCKVLLGPFLENVILSLGGKGSCAVIDWTFLSLSLADWSLICFIFLLSGGLLLVFRNSEEAASQNPDQH